MSFLKITALTFSLLFSNSVLAMNNNHSWDYLVKTFSLINDQRLTQELKNLGEKKWELVSCPVSKVALTCIFKKPK